MSISRRNFLKTSAAGVAALSVAVPRVHAGESDLIKVGLIGCGGRGRGAAANTLNADPNTKIVAVADAFMPNAQGAVEGLKTALKIAFSPVLTRTSLSSRLLILFFFANRRVSVIVLSPMRSSRVNTFSARNRLRLTCSGSSPLWNLRRLPRKRDSRLFPVFAGDMI